MGPPGIDLQGKITSQVRLERSQKIFLNLKGNLTVSYRAQVAPVRLAA